MSIIVGDCLEVMRTLEANSVDAIVTDPPYHLTTGKKGGTGPASINVNSPAGRARIGTGFMGKAWDGGDIAHRPETWAEALRVAKPGAYLLAFGGTRTYHRLACAIEDAGWELRDTLMWVFGSGFPKSHNGEFGGTALKPAWEPIVMARKPLIGTVEANWREHGTGALNIDACRVELDGDYKCKANGRPSQTGLSDNYDAAAANKADTIGRWPANLVHDGSDEVLAAFPNAPGQQGDLTGSEPSRPTKNTYGEYKGRREFKARRDGEASADRRYTEEGGTNFAPLPGMRREATSAARFFYCAKASREDRNHGCEAFAERPLLWSSGDKSPGSFQGEGTNRASSNNHPTVKPTELMRYLCRLVTPRGGLVLDPFTGSGSTGRGAIAEGLRFTGIELDPHYASIAEARIRAIQSGLSL